MMEGWLKIPNKDQEVMLIEGNPFPKVAIDMTSANWPA